MSEPRNMTDDAPPIPMSETVSGVPSDSADTVLGTNPGDDTLFPTFAAEMEAAGWTEERALAKGAKFAELKAQYPNHYIAYREVWAGDHLVEPFLLAVAVNEIEVEKAIQSLPPEQAREAIIHYLMPLNQAMMTPFWVINVNGPQRKPTE